MVAAAITSTMTEPVDPRTPPSPERSRRRSSPILPASSPVFASLDAAAAAVSPSRQPILSPPPTPRASRPRSAKLTFRLRSNSGLSLHTNEDALRQYIDYLPDGSPRSPLFAPVNWRPEGSGFGATTTPEAVPAALLPIPDFCSREVFDMVLQNQTLSQRLWRFAHSQGCGMDMEYLMKIQEYGRSVGQLTSLLSTISTSHTSLTASNPVQLLPTMSKSLNSNIKHVTSSLLPGLEALFLESRVYVEQRVARELYPAFVKNQLAVRTSISLVLDNGQGMPSPASPGLGEAFCMTDGSRPGNPIVAASYGFVGLAGKRPVDFMNRSCQFLQTPLTDRATVERIRDAVNRKQECVELILNQREDGSTFWNLLYICPLVDDDGEARFYLGAPINVSELISNNRDLLDTLNYSTSTIPDAAKGETPSAPPGRRPSRVARQPSTRAPPDRKAAAASGEDGESRKPPAARKTGFFRSFRKAASPTSSFRPKSSRGGADSAWQSSSDLMAESPASVSVAAQRLASLTPLDAICTPYSRLIVLRNTTAEQNSTASSPDAGTAGKRKPASSSSSSSSSSRLLVSFCSQGALETLGLGPVADTIYDQDIFTVLAEQANSPSISRSFKSAVFDLVIREGQTAALDLLVGAGPAGASRQVTSPSGEQLPSEGSDTERRGGSNSGPSTSSRPKMQPLISFWTALKGEQGRVGWVTLVLSPSLT